MTGQLKFDCTDACVVVHPDRNGAEATLVVVAGTTATARIEGISAAGAAPDLLAHTPSADVEIVADGRPADGRPLPVSPTGCPTPAVVTRAVRDLAGFEFSAVDAGLARPTAVPTVDLGAAPGGDLREPEPVPEAGPVFDRAREAAADLDGPLLIGETIPGGTTTALGVLAALGERPTVSSSLPENPIERKREVVAEGLAESGLEAGDAAGAPLDAVRRAGDPVLAAVAGLIAGAAGAGTGVTLAGGTQMAAAAALARHREIDASLTLATTSFVAGDETASIDALADDLDLTLVVTDPGFEAEATPATDAYVVGEVKEGVGMGGVLALADRADVGMAAVRDRVVARYEQLHAEGSTP